MLEGIVLYTAIMIVGIYLGKKGFLKNLLKNNMDRVFTILLMILLFIMGISFGNNKEIIKSLSKIGYKAFLIALGTIVFATLFIYLGNKIYDNLLKNNKK